MTGVPEVGYLLTNRQLIGLFYMINTFRFLGEGKPFLWHVTNDNYLHNSMVV